MEKKSCSRHARSLVCSTQRDPNQANKWNNRQQAFRNTKFEAFKKYLLVSTNMNTQHQIHKTQSTQKLSPLNLTTPMWRTAVIWVAINSKRKVNRNPNLSDSWPCVQPIQIPVINASFHLKCAQDNESKLLKIQHRGGQVQCNYPVAMGYFRKTISWM
jgi:hypothetical protein